MAKPVFPGRDEKTRKVNVKYRNYNRNVDREMFRSVCQVVMIPLVDELNLVQQLGEIASAVDLQLSPRKEIGL